MKNKKPKWDQVKCLNCGHEWNASDGGGFNISFCGNCHNTDPKQFSGEYYRKDK